MWERVETVAGMSAIGLMLMIPGCASTSGPSIESARLTETDIEILRETSESDIQPLIAASTAKRVAVLATTLAIPLWQAPTPSFPPASPPLFGGVAAHPPVPVTHAVNAELLTPEERAAWQLRNRVSREMPEVAVAGWVIRHSAESSEAETIVAFSAPSYPTKNSALLYAQFTCGGTCGEGRLIRLTRDGSAWRVTASIQLWIS
jgi:hypothetical protein